jgi:hypothetical protein
VSDAHKDWRLFAHMIPRISLKILMYVLLCAGHTVKHFTCHYLLNHHNHLYDVGAIVILILQMRKGGTEELSDLPTVIGKINSRGGIPILVIFQYRNPENLLLMYTYIFYF